jgi:hypothetical protein
LKLTLRKWFGYYSCMNCLIYKDLFGI